MSQRRAIVPSSRAAACWIAWLLAAPFALAQGATWSWFAEPFEVRVLADHPQAGPMEGRIVVAADAVRVEWRVAGVPQVSVARPEGDGVRLWLGMPDGSVNEVLLGGVDAFEWRVHGYVAAVTAPDDPRHPCTATPDTHRCAREGDETVDGRPLERWRIEADTRDGGTHAQTFWFDRAEGVVVRALDETGADLRFVDHRRGPVDPAAFDLP